MTLFAPLPTVAAILIAFAFLPNFCALKCAWGSTGVVVEKLEVKECSIRQIYCFKSTCTAVSTNEDYFGWGCTEKNDEAQNKEWLINGYIKPNSNASDWKCHFEFGKLNQSVPFPLPEGASAVGPKVFALMALVLPLIFAVASGQLRLADCVWPVASGAGCVLGQLRLASCVWPIASGQLRLEPVASGADATGQTQLARRNWPRRNRPQTQLARRNRPDATGQTQLARFDSITEKRLIGEVFKSNSLNEIYLKITISTGGRKFQVCGSRCGIETQNFAGQDQSEAIGDISKWMMAGAAAMTGLVICLSLLHLIFVSTLISDEKIRSELYWVVLMPPVIVVCGFTGMVLLRAALFLYAIALV
ncbi:hypothetical protein niasHT_030016 [Heterodera trifolii]|uniref:Transmembrane protein n=1 Tax=Heterodera trifolii TaxID=157864 RepID=A0ABD2JRR1_9BILA